MYPYLLRLRIACNSLVFVVSLLPHPRDSE